MRLRDTLEIGDRDIHVTWCEQSQNLQFPHLQSLQCRSRLQHHFGVYTPVPVQGAQMRAWVGGNAMCCHSHRRPRWELSSSPTALLCHVCFTYTQPTQLNGKGTALLLVMQKSSQWGTLLLFLITCLATRSSPFMNVSLEFQYPHKLEIIPLILPTLQKKTKLKTAGKGSGTVESIRRHCQYFLLKLGY